MSNQLDAPYTGTPVYLAIGLASAETAADLEPGEYLLRATTDVCFRFNASGGGDAAVWCAAPAIYLAAGDTFWTRRTIPFRVEAIALEASQYLMILPIS